jgi:hypothetical protein
MPIVLKSGSLNLLALPEPVQGCTRSALIFSFTFTFYIPYSPPSELGYSAFKSFASYARQGVKLGYVQDKMSEVCGGK